MEQSQIPPQLSNSKTSASLQDEQDQIDVSTIDTSLESDKSVASTEREFSIRATNFDRGQLKLRIASKRVKKPNKDCASSPESLACDDVSEKQDSKASKATDLAQDNLDILDNAVTIGDTSSKKVIVCSNSTLMFGKQGRFTIKLVVLGCMVTLACKVDMLDLNAS